MICFVYWSWPSFKSIVTFYGFNMWGSNRWLTIPPSRKGQVFTSEKWSARPSRFHPFFDEVKWSARGGDGQPSIWTPHKCNWYNWGSTWSFGIKFGTGNVWFKSVVKHPPPGTGGDFTPIISPTLGISRKNFPQPRGFHLQYTPHPRVFHEKIFPNPGVFICNILPTPGDFTIFGDKKWNAPGGGCLTNDLNHTLWPPLHNFPKNGTLGI